MPCVKVNRVPMLASSHAMASVTSLAVTQVPPTSIPASGVLTAASSCSARCRSRYVTQAIEPKAWFTP